MTKHLIYDLFVKKKKKKKKNIAVLSAKLSCMQGFAGVRYLYASQIDPCCRVYHYIYGMQVDGNNL